MFVDGLEAFYIFSDKKQYWRAPKHVYISS